MRRFTVSLSLALVVLLGVVALQAPPVVIAQEATPAAEPVPRILQAWLDGVNTGDGAAVAALYAEDGSHEDVPAQEVTQGRDQIANIVNVLPQLGDFHMSAMRGQVSGDLAVLEYTTEATDPESGKPWHLRGVLIFELEDGLIRRSVDYYDVATILSQLGMLDMGQLMEEATPTP
jgi:steroid delta-isomerase-like uncharacterized protein